MARARASLAERQDFILGPDEQPNPPRSPASRASDRVRFLRGSPLQSHNTIKHLRSGGTAIADRNRISHRWRSRATGILDGLVVCGRIVLRHHPDGPRSRLERDRSRRRNAQQPICGRKGAIACKAAISAPHSAQSSWPCLNGTTNGKRVAPSWSPSSEWEQDHLS